MPAECLKNNQGGWKQALSETGVGNEGTSLYLCCIVLTKAFR